MEPDILRWIDRRIGTPICWILTFLRNMAAPFRQRPEQVPDTILIIKMSEMGSTVLAYPALMEMKRRLSDARMFFLVFDGNGEIFQALGVASDENVISVRTTNLATLFWDGLRALRRLLQLHITITIDMDFFSRFSAIIAFLVCRGRRVGFHAFSSEGLNRGDLLTHRVNYSPHVHTSRAFLTLVMALFEEAEVVPHYKHPAPPEAIEAPLYQADPELKRKLSSRLEDRGIPIAGRRGKVVLVNPNSSMLFPLRKWPLSYFKEFCALLLSERPEDFVVLTGAADEIEETQAIMDSVRNARCISLAGQTSFRELLALYSLADLLVTNDSGPAHFASMLRLPTLVLFGPETPLLYHPLGTSSKCLYAGFACSPCVSVYNAKKSPCRDNRCLQVLSPRMVGDEALTLLQVESRK